MPKASKIQPFDYSAFLAKYGGGRILECREKQIIYAQGDLANTVFYLISGTAEIKISSEFGKEAVIALLHAGDFFGESCLDEHLLRTSTIMCEGDCKVVQFEKSIVARALNDDSNFAKLFLTFLLNRNEILKADLIDHFFNSSEKRLARILLALASMEENTMSQFIVPSINQDLLAKMVGTSRPRINGFMTKFRKLGYIEYNGQLKVHNSLFNIIASEKHI
jgi:CRP/FNR family transcriptional regulator, cyclic AMP receptor protein